MGSMNYLMVGTGGAADRLVSAAVLPRLRNDVIGVAAVEPNSTFATPPGSPAC